VAQLGPRLGDPKDHASKIASKDPAEIDAVIEQELPRRPPSSLVSLYTVRRRRLSSITCAPRRKVTGVPGQRSQAAR
jgi:hypothetical protein